MIKITMNKKKYSEKQMVSFGNYLLSQKRTERIVTNHLEDNRDIIDIINQVYDADLANWKAENIKVKYFMNELNDFFNKV